MRKLVYMALGFAAGCGVGAYLFAGKLLLILGTLCLVPAIGFLFLPNKKPAFALFGAVASLLWTFTYSALYVTPAAKYDGVTDSFSVTITDYGTESAYGTNAEGKISLQGKTYALKLYFSSPISVEPGDVVAGTFRLSYTEEGYHRGAGVFLLGYQEGMCQIVQEGGRYSHLPAKLRHSILGVLDKIFPAEGLGFARALLLGDTSHLTYDQTTALKVSGIYHVVSVSGLHVSILFALLYLLAGKKRVLTALLGIPALFLFAAVAGFTPSITRACIMQALMILAMLLKREYDPPSALALACLVILAQNPLAIGAVGFQLSVGCMIGIFLFSSRIRNYFYTAGDGWKQRLRKMTVSSLSITLGTMVVTAPLCALYFGYISIIGLLTNLLTLWLITILFYGVIVACVLCLLSPVLAQGVASILTIPIRFVLWLAGFFRKLPFAAVYTDSLYILLWVLFGYGLLTLFWYRGRKSWKALVSALTATLMVAMLLSWVEPKLENYRVTILDVGQGQCILLQSRGKTYMVDCGGDSDKQTAQIAADALLSQGISAIDGVILTHYDRDHIGGLPYFLAHIDTKALYLPMPGEAIDLSPYEGENQIFVDKNMVLSCGKGKITLVPGLISDGDNESSTCILFQAGECDILITGDRGMAGEELLLRQIAVPKLEVLVAGHHGSKDSTGLPLLNHTRPDTVILSVGEDNHYGHPHSGTLIRLDVFDCRVLRTDHHGTIILRG